MAHFQLPSSKLLPGGSRLFPSGNSGFERLVLEPGKQVALELAGLAPSAQPTVMTTGSDLTAVTVSKLSGSGSTRHFTITANSPGTTWLAAKDAGGNNLGTNPLFLIFVGHFQNYPGFSKDLIADVFRSSDAAKMHVLTQTLFNNWENLFNESSEGNQRNWCKDYEQYKKRCLPCGTVSKVGGSKIWKPIGYHYQNAYYEPIPQAKRNSSLQRADIKYKDTRIEAACKAIQNRLTTGEPSVVGLVYYPGTAIRSDGSFLVTGAGGHSVPIVGCDTNATQFLYIDVYPNGSKLKYLGGHAGRNLFPEFCTFLGIFELQSDASRGTKVLRQQTDSGNFFNDADDSFLEVVSGPIDATSKGT